MKKVGIQIVALGILIFGFTAIVVGCGQTTETTPTPTPTPTTITLSGKLTSGKISSTGIKSLGAASGYKVVAIDNNTGKTYYSSSDATGNFSIDIPADASYEVSLIDENSKYFGPMVMVGDASSSEAVMGIIPTDNTNLGEVIVDSSKGIANPTSDPTSIANFSDKAQASNGVPKGAGKSGKEQISGITTREGADMDKDGISNLFDADEDNDGIRNGVASAPSTQKVISNTIEAVYYGMNIWSKHGSAYEAKDRIDLRLNVQPKSGKENLIQSVKAIDVPAAIKEFATIFGQLPGRPSDYPTEGTLWESVDYKMYLCTGEGTMWRISIIPRANLNVGDTFTFRVTYSDGSPQDFFLTICYVLTDVSRIIKYNNIDVPADKGTDYTNPITFETSGLTLESSKPKDEDGNIIAGLSYSIIINYLDSGGSRLGNWNEYPVPDTGEATLSYLTGTLTTEVAGAPIDTYYICPVSQTQSGGSGQRNGEEIWFKKQ